MRMKALSLKGITRFKEPITIDFDALGPGLIALAGPNGAGKSTLLEAPYATLFGEMATRPGSLYGVASGRDATLELAFENGESYRALVSIDAIAQRSEAYLFDGDGRPITDGKMRTFAAAVEERFGSARLMLAAALSAQNHRGSFLELSKADRKDLLCNILDVAGLQRLSEAARATVKAGELQLERLRGQLAEAEAEVERLAGAGPTEDLQVERARLEAEITTTQADLEAMRERHADLQTQQALALEAEKQRAGKQRELLAIDEQSCALVVKLKALPAEAARARTRAEAGIFEAEREAERLFEYDAAATALPPARGRRTQAQDDLREWNAALREAREVLLAKTRETGKAATIRTRLAAAQRQAGLLGEVPCTGSPRWTAEYADSRSEVAHLTNIQLGETCPLLADARGAKAAIAALEGELADAEALEAALPEYQQAVDRAEVAVKDGLAALQKAEAEVERLAPLAGGVATAQAAVKRAAELQEQLEETLANLAAREQEYQEQIDDLVRKRTALAVEVEGMEATDAAGIKAEMDVVARQGQELRVDVEQLQDGLREIERAITEAELQAKRRAELTERCAASRKAADQLAADLGEWGLLERAFGREGIQALEIDAAAPELSATGTDLLRAFGERFEMKLITLQPRADGKGEKEVFDAVFLDHERGREGPLESFSGGEKVILAEALSLALAVFVGRHSGRRFSTMWRDETAGALDPENANRYIAMLRRARVLTGATQIIFVAQQPEVWSQADSILWVENGRVEVKQ